ncbi:tRNA (guanine37-N1) -methyltransferase [Sporolactobacillus inulinus]|nr:tRNA (guanine37-N1) -methyltransferase [Sporolactobacillus inulinus]
MKVPDLLLSGNHEKIAEWRLKESLRRTYERRPDLLEGLSLTDQEEKWLRAWKKDADHR